VERRYPVIPLTLDLLPGGHVNTNYAAARLADLAALCEKLAWPTHRGAVTTRALAQIDRILRAH
jgi:hypothetical protein